jgi:hypothetical protein
MKCPKCGYVSYDYLDACRKCGRDLITFKQEIGLQMLRPGDLDLSVVLSGSAAASSGRDDFTIDANFFSGQLFEQGGTVEADEAEFDISLDDDFPLPPAAAESVPPSPPEAGQHEDTVLLEDMASTLLEEQPPEVAKPSPTRDLAVDMIDMSDLEEADTVALDALETAGTQSPGADDTFVDIDLTMSDTLRIDDTLSIPVEDLTVETQGMEPPTVMADPASEELPDTELELELDRLDEESSDAEDTTLLLDPEHRNRRDDDTRNTPRPPERT